MIITCEKCLSQYDVPDEYFGENGKVVRCASCGYEWLQKSLKDSIFDKIEENYQASYPVQKVERDIAPVDKVPEVEIDSSAVLAKVDEALNQFNFSEDEPAAELEVVVENIAEVKTEATVPQEEKSTTAITDTPDNDYVPEEPVMEKPQPKEQQIDVEKLVEETKSFMQKICPLKFCQFMREHFSFQCNPSKFHPIAFGIVIFTALMLLSFTVLVVGRSYIVNHYPAMDYFYAKIGIVMKAPGEGLKINNLQVVRGMADDGSYNIHIKGEFVNLVKKQMSFPKMQIVLKDRDNKALKTWQPQQPNEVIDPEKAHPFEIAFPNIPEEGVLVEVSIIG